MQNKNTNGYRNLQQQHVLFITDLKSTQKTDIFGQIHFLIKSLFDVIKIVEEKI